MPATLGGLSKVVSVTAGPVVPLFNLDVARNRTFFVGRHARWSTTTPRPTPA